MDEYEYRMIMMTTMMIHMMMMMMINMMMMTLSDLIEDISIST
jgi:hypothetical protein